MDLGEDDLAGVRAAMARLTSAVQFPVLAPLVAEHLATGGKFLRARLALTASSALGAPAAGALAWATACELMHNATLVHDDLQDGDTTRRGAPTIWAKYGAAQAINVGDLLLMAPYRAVLEAQLPEATSAALCRALVEAIMRVVEGQAAECAMTAAGTGDAASYRAMVAGKTSALFVLPVHGAALVAGRPWAEARALAAPFAELGTMFQLQDDVLDLFGDKGRAQIGSDLGEGKVSALVVRHLERAPGDAAWLTALLRAPRAQTSAAQVAEAARRFAASGALGAVLADIEAGAARAEAQVHPSLRPQLVALCARVRAPIAHVQREPSGRASTGHEGGAAAGTVRP